MSAMFDDGCSDYTLLHTAGNYVAAQQATTLQDASQLVHVCMGMRETEAMLTQRRYMYYVSAYIVGNHFVGMYHKWCMIVWVMRECH